MIRPMRCRSTHAAMPPSRPRTAAIAVRSKSRRGGVAAEDIVIRYYRDGDRLRSDMARNRALSDREYQALAQFSACAAASSSASPNKRRARPASRPRSTSSSWRSGVPESRRAPVVGDLAEALQLRHHSVVELIDRADAAGLVTRRPDPADLRRQQVLLTAAGRRRARAAVDDPPRRAAPIPEGDGRRLTRAGLSRRVRVRALA